jgi:tetratricopeptide (TPR) repeat protein
MLEVATTLERKGVRLARQGLVAEALAAYDEILVRYPDATEPRLREAVTRALSNRASLLALSRRNDEAIVVAESLADRLAHASEPNAPRSLARGLAGEAMALFQQERWEEAVAVFDTLVSRFGDAEDPSLRGIAAIALINKTEALAQLGEMEEAIAAHQQVITRFGDDAVRALDEIASESGAASNPAVREQLAAILLKKGLVLSELDRPDEARSTLNDVIARFEGDEQESIQRVVAAAREARDQLVDADD